LPYLPPSTPRFTQRPPRVFNTTVLYVLRVFFVFSVVNLAFFALILFFLPPSTPRFTQRPPRVFNTTVLCVLPVFFVFSVVNLAVSPHSAASAILLKSLYLPKIIA
jgi:hypothetical protein